MGGNTSESSFDALDDIEEDSDSDGGTEIGFNLEPSQIGDDERHNGSGRRSTLEDDYAVTESPGSSASNPIIMDEDDGSWNASDEDGALLESTYDVEELDNDGDTRMA